ncbi:unnamed protein product [Paramecium sonneborni]|uniref:Uncharacterized protein n=1 Tax=Paramecium sonneborni TaxID=65129 RepID=A0A8S1MIA4_9CILI|nr:unnamed protein product [Paramecium sonneborni]
MNANYDDKIGKQVNFEIENKAYKLINMNSVKERLSYYDSGIEKILSINHILGLKELESNLMIKINYLTQPNDQTLQACEGYRFQNYDQSQLIQFVPNYFQQIRFSKVFNSLRKQLSSPKLQYQGSIKSKSEAKFKCSYFLVFNF